MAEIKTLDAGTWSDPAFAGETIVTLREWFEFTDRRVGLYPEIKNPDLYPGIIENVADELTDLGYTSKGRARNGAPQIWIQAREPRHVQAAHELLPDVPVAASGHDRERYSYVTASGEVLNEYASWAAGTCATRNSPCLRRSSGSRTPACTVSARSLTARSTSRWPWTSATTTRTRSSRTSTPTTRPSRQPQPAVE